LTSNGKNTTAWPGFTFEFRLKTRRFDATNYDILAKEDLFEPAAKSPQPTIIAP
jgi:hypothetical protein